MTPHETEGGIDLEKIVALAQANTEESRQQVDSLLPTICDDPSVVSWARQNTKNPESPLRDLAATILTATATELDDTDFDNLVSMLHEDDPSNPYPRFRAACALVKKNLTADFPLIRAEVISVLREFVNDEDVADIAREHLGLLGSVTD